MTRNPVIYIFLFVAVSCIAMIRMWNRFPPRVGMEITFPQDSVRALAFLPGTNNLLVGDDKGVMRIVDTTNRTWKTAFKSPYPEDPDPRWTMCISVSPDGEILAIARMMSAILWDVSKRKMIRPLKCNTYVTCVSLSPDGHKLATGGAGRLRVWNTEDGKELWGKEIDWPAVAFSPDGRSVAGEAAHGDGSACLALWNAANGKTVINIAGQQLQKNTPLLFSPDSQLLAWINEDRLRVYDLSSHRIIRDNTEPPHSWAVSASFSPDGTVLALGCRSYEHAAHLELWDIGPQTLRKKGEWQDGSPVPLTGRARGGHSETLVAYSPDGSSIAVGYGHVVRIIKVKEMTRS